MNTDYLKEKFDKGITFCKEHKGLVIGTAALVGITVGGALIFKHYGSMSDEILTLKDKVEYFKIQRNDYQALYQSADRILRKTASDDLRRGGSLGAKILVERREALKCYKSFDWGDFTIDPYEL